MENFLSVTDVHQKFRSGFWLKSAHILKGVSLNVSRGAVFGFIGPNGAGKTTLIHLIVGLKQPFSGQVRLNGIPTGNPQARLNIGYLPERPYFHEHLSGDQLLKYFGALSGMSPGDVDSRIPQVLETVGMGHARHQKLRSYSKGMLQRIGIAQAILHDPEFLVFDEPMSGLDPVGRKEIRELILHLASRGKTVFFSTHVIPDVEAICDQVGLIQKGKLIGYGPITHFLQQTTAKNEIGFSGLTEQQVEKLGLFSAVRRTSEGFRATFEGEANIMPVLSKLMAEKAKIQSLSPVHSSLEDVFSKSTAAGDA